MAVAGATVRDALGGARDAIAASGSRTARLDAELLLSEASGLDRAALAADPDATLPVGAAREFATMVRRRVRREPVAYILGRKGFRHIELAVDPRVLVPRPETELLVEAAVEVAPASVLDIGTGSGAVALAVADELPAARVVATDVSPAALEVTSANAARLGLAERVEVIAGSYPAGRGPFDLVVANLPYVTEAEWRALDPGVREFEPREALVPGPSGLEAIGSVLDQIRDAGEKPGAIALEHGEGQADAVEAMVRAAGFREVERRPDLAGIERIVIGR